MAAKVIKVALTKVKETKGTHVYGQEPGELPVLGHVYVAKQTFGENPPARITVSIKAE